MKTTLVLVIFVFAHNTLFAQLLPPPALPPARHHEIGGLKARSVFQALNKLIINSTYFELETLECKYIFDRWESGRAMYDCHLRYRVDAHADYQEAFFKDQNNLSLAENLYNALLEAEAGEKPQRYGAVIILKNICSAYHRLVFDDHSMITLPPEPNLSIEGDVAQHFLDFLDALKINDSDRSLFIVCHKFKAEPECGYQFQHSAFPLDAELSSKLWNLLKLIAQRANFKTSWGGPLDEITVMNLSCLSFDGLRLKMLFAAGNALAPPGF